MKLVPLFLLGALALAGCSTAPADDGSGSGAPAGDGGSSSASHEACTDPMTTPSPNATGTYEVLDAGAALPEGFAYVSDLGPSCIIKTSADGLTHYTSYFVGATQDEVDSAYAASSAVAADRGWTTVEDDGDALGDGFVYGDWVENPDDALSQDLVLQAFMPLGPDYAPSFGLSDDTTLLGIEIVVKG